MTRCVEARLSQFEVQPLMRDRVEQEANAKVWWDAWEAVWSPVERRVVDSGREPVEFQLWEEL